MVTMMESLQAQYPVTDTFTSSQMAVTDTFNIERLVGNRYFSGRAHCVAWDCFRLNHFHRRTTRP